MLHICKLRLLFLSVWTIIHLCEDTSMAEVSYCWLQVMVQLTI